MSSGRRSLIGALVVALWGLAPGGAAAQVFTPAMLSPVRGSDLGVYLSGGFGPAGDLALEAVQRRGMGGYDLGLRAGIGDTGTGVVVLLGADYRRPVEVDVEVDFAPLIFAATGGAQLAVGADLGLGVDAGVSVGSTFASQDMVITPYLNPRLALVETLRVGATLDLALLADLGVDVDLGANWIGRVALGLGGPTANFSIGLAWR